MRTTQFTFFVILILLTSVLAIIIIGENKYFAKEQSLPGPVEEIISSSSVEEESAVIALANDQTEYQDSVKLIFITWQQQILQQSISREDAAQQIREQLLSLADIPSEMQNVHLQLVLALTKDISGARAEANQIIQSISENEDWLQDSLIKFMQ
ncbi:MAG: hypothetical protein AUJ28_03600 [Parcubacteria group bacterium CG1_02_37_51]|uniref:Uncharacterized protein n=1 Tax=Candidatus Komeilibacteria bacterium CG_4_10_14_0_8_um_filter_37_78 TaxID=1974471 RepID=A0A2M7REI5_9BACT|nr:MAG: hypothetical protein AUJ28_03600 [Parcubacteria group bacterium CG1_02_37_51]PIY94756.1 MAG: hypothetical protein COY67_02125 [Candidatus Komeilibacteria bacterium CG_4_10_14_0_8_um_filter_37_78]